jgi:hypothetical protein
MLDTVASPRIQAAGDTARTESSKKRCQDNEFRQTGHELNMSGKATRKSRAEQISCNHLSTMQLRIGRYNLTTNLPETRGFEGIGHGAAIAPTGMSFNSRMDPHLPKSERTSHDTRKYKTLAFRRNRGYQIWGHPLKSDRESSRLVQ